jgi:transcription elongation regulator 1
LFAKVKKKIVDDARYDAVGSSSLREELFNTFLKARGIPSSSTPEPGETEEKRPNVEDEVDEEQKRKERKERAVREREEKIKAERSKLDAEIDRSRSGLNKGESELEFRCAE